MVDDADLPDAAYIPLVASGLAVGDICQGVVLPDPTPSTELFQSDALRGRFLVPAVVTYVVVMHIFEGYAIVAPLTTADTAGDRHQFDALVSAGRSAREWVRLPELDIGWEGDAVALLFMAQTVPVPRLENLRLASLSDDARDVFAHRVALAFQD